jgi:hypothetical protein
MGYEIKPVWEVDRASWWQHKLETDWATEAAIQHEIGPEYMMHYDALDIAPCVHRLYPHTR